MFPIHRIEASRRAADEQLGTKSKFWFFDEENRRFLFKAEERGTGEDWAEKIVCELCKLIGLPHVHYELAAEYDGARFVSPGVICESCHWQLLWYSAISFSWNAMPAIPHMTPISTKYASIPSQQSPMPSGNYYRRPMLGWMAVPRRLIRLGRFYRC